MKTLTRSLLRLQNNEHITPRELEVLRFMALGYTSQQIAHALGVSPCAIRQHVMHVKDKTGIITHAGLGAWIIKSGII